MLLLHCADIHLDSKLGEHYTKEQGIRRNLEILARFSNLADYAASEGASGILICGDLFDTEKTKRETRDTVAGIIRNHPEIAFFYLRGNHDRNGMLSEYGLPNLYTFETSYQAYRIGAVTVGGVELTSENAASLSKLRYSDPDGIHILMLHGQAGEYGRKKDAEQIPLRELKNKGIDYLALGHIHSYRAFPLDSRGTCVYSGCLEPRGFDEPGMKGFVRIEIDENAGTVTHRFVPFAKRTLIEVPVDVSECDTSEDCRRKILEQLDRHPICEDNMLCVVLTGTKPVTAEFDTEYLALTLRDRFYLVSAEDRTELVLKPEDFEFDRTLSGEFVRSVLADPRLSEEEQKTIVMLGLKALNGGKIA